MTQRLMRDYFDNIQGRDLDVVTPTSREMGQMFYALGRQDGGVSMEGFEVSNEALLTVRERLYAAPNNATVQDWARSWDRGVEESHELIDDRRAEEWHQAH